MPWFMAILVRGSRVDGVRNDLLIGDLLYRLVRASDAEEAYEKAVAIGKETTDSYTDEEGRSITLQSLGLKDLYQIPAAELQDGVEVYCEILGEKPSDVVVEKGALSAFVPEERPISEELDASEDLSSESISEEPLHPR
jgi:hypothetical protein